MGNLEKKTNKIFVYPGSGVTNNKIFLISLHFSPHFSLVLGITLIKLVICSANFIVSAPKEQ